MANSLQNTIDYIQPFCRYQAAGIGQNGQPILGIASLVRNIILAAPFTWDFNRDEDQSINLVQGVQDYPSTITDFGFLEKASLLDSATNEWEQFDDVQNNEALAKSNTQSRPSVIAVQGFGLAPTLGDVIVSGSKFQFGNFTAATSFSFTVPATALVDDQLVFVVEVSGGTGSPATISDLQGNTYTLISSVDGGGGTHNMSVYNAPITTGGTITVSMTFSGTRSVLVQGLLLRGTGSILLTSPVNNTSTSVAWASVGLTTTQPYTALITFDAAYGPPAFIADSFQSSSTGLLPGSSPTTLQLDTAVDMAVTTGTYQSHFIQNTSAQWITVLVGFPANSEVGLDAPVFRFSAVPDKAYPVDLVYQMSPENFTQPADLWSPIPDSFSDVYNNLVLGYYMDSCQDPRAPQYISRGIAGLLARASGLSATDKAVFAASYMSYAQAQAVSALTTQQGTQAQGAR